MTEVIDSAVCLPEFVAASRRWANIERAVRGFGWSPYSHERDGELFYGLMVHSRSKQAATPCFNSEAALDEFLRRTQFY